MLDMYVRIGQNIIIFYRNSDNILYLETNTEFCILTVFVVVSN